MNNAQVTFQLTDSSSPPLTGFATLGLTITPTITPPVLTITQNQPFSTTLAATGGTGQLTWSITSGALPTGVTLVANTGVISGTTTQPLVSNSPLTIQVKDAGSQTTATLNTTFTIISAGPVQNTTTSLATAVIGSTYSQTLTAQSGMPPYTWSITPLPLPGKQAKLERKIGQQTLEIDFLKKCLQRIEEQRMVQALNGNPLSTGRSKSKSGGKRP